MSVYRISLVWMTVFLSSVMFFLNCDPTPPKADAGEEIASEQTPAESVTEPSAEATQDASPEAQAEAQPEAQPEAQAEAQPEVVAEQEPLERLPATLSLNDSAYPEDTAVHEGYLYVSNWLNGSILKMEIARPNNLRVFVPATEAGAVRPQGWGVSVHSSKGWLLSIMNPPFDFQNTPPIGGAVRAYNLTTGAQEKEWLLPNGVVANSMVVDSKGFVYVNDVTPASRLFRIDPANDKVELWKEDKVKWPATNFGHGGMVFDGVASIYTATQGKLWKVAISSDGSAGEVQEVRLDKPVQSDGMTWAGNNTIYFAQNDAFVAGPNGSVFQIVLDGVGATTGKINLFKDKIKDPSGILVTSYLGKPYIIVNESQFGHVFKIDSGDPTKPFKLLVYEP